MSTRRLTGICMILAATTLTASPASAAKKEPFCSVVANLGDLGSGTGQTSSNEAKRLAKAFKDASKKTDAPKNVTKAMSNIGAFYDAVSKAKNPSDYAGIAGRNAQKYASALSTFTQYYVKECAIASTTSTTRSSNTSTTAGTSTTGGSSSGGGVVVGVFNGAAATATVGTCSVNSSSGSLRSSDGSFQLTWSNGNYTLVWTVQGMTFNGSVTAQASGNSIVFTGSSGSNTVQAVVTCT